MSQKFSLAPKIYVALSDVRLGGSGGRRGMRAISGREARGCGAAWRGVNAARESPLGKSARRAWSYKSGKTRCLRMVPSTRAASVACTKSEGGPKHKPEPESVTVTCHYTAWNSLLHLCCSARPRPDPTRSPVPNRLTQPHRNQQQPRTSLLYRVAPISAPRGEVLLSITL